MYIDRLFKSLEVKIKNNKLYCNIDDICLGDSLLFSDRKDVAVKEGIFSKKGGEFEYFVEVTRIPKELLKTTLVPWELKIKDFV